MAHTVVLVFEFVILGPLGIMQALTISLLSNSSKYVTERATQYVI